MDLYADFNRRLTLAGHIVYTVATVSTGNHVELTPLEKVHLDLVHLKKILESEAVVIVTDETRYIGESTRRELDWARLTGKRVYEGVRVDSLCRSGIWWDHDRKASTRACESEDSA